MWRDLPERYGPRQTAYERFARWEADGDGVIVLAGARASELGRT